MAGMFEKVAYIYGRARPTYPDEWFSKLASLTTHHKVAWDVGTGNGQAALKVAKHYKRVIATDVAEGMIKHAFPHPKVHYVHTPPTATDDELIALLGGEGSVDIVTVAAAVHWFNLPSFYSVVNRVLRKPGGIIAVWGYTYKIKLSSSDHSPFDPIMKRIYNTAKPYIDPRAYYVFEEYETLPFPFESVGMGSEGNPLDLEMELELSLDEFITWKSTWSAAAKAKEQGVHVVDEEVMRDVQAIWGESSANEKKRITLKAFMLAGKPKLAAGHTH